MFNISLKHVPECLNKFYIFIVRVLHKLKKDIFKALNKLKLTKGDQVYCSVSLSFLGTPKFSVRDSKELCKSFSDIILEIIGINGSLFTPCFSYSFKTTKLTL